MFYERRILDRVGYRIEAPIWELRSGRWTYRDQAIPTPKRSVFFAHGRVLQNIYRLRFHRFILHTDLLWGSVQTVFFGGFMFTGFFFGLMAGLVLPRFKKPVLIWFLKMQAEVTEKK